MSARAKSSARAYASGLSMTSRSTSLVKRSRIVRSTRSRSRWMSAGAGVSAAARCTFSQRRVRKRTSSWISFLVAPSQAVRTMSPPSAGRSASTIGRGRHLGGQRAGDAQIGDVEEGRLFEADVDERRLHAGQHAHDLALVDVAGDALLAAMLDPEVDERRLLEDGHAGLPGRDVDEDLLAHG